MIYLMSKISKYLFWLVRPFIYFVLFIAIAIYFILRSSVADYQHELVDDGLKSGLEIIRDPNAIPHIYANSLGDAYYGLGFAHGQDRLWQLEVMHAAINGTLSEIFGVETLEMDKLTLAADGEKIATLSRKRLTSETIHLLQRYVDGVNSYISNRTGFLPPEFLIFSIKPSLWTTNDCLALFALIALGSDNWQSELQRAQMKKYLSVNQIKTLFPDYPSNGPISHKDTPTQLTVKKFDKIPVGSTVLENVDMQLKKINKVANNSLIKSYPASNTWVVDGTKTISGLPILASDPHGPLKAPADYYLARLVGPNFDITGVGYVGLPIFAIGHNRNIAWGITDIIADRSDLHWEQIIDGKPNYYRTFNGSEKFIIREQTINIKGGEKVALTLRSTINGPVISDVQSDSKSLTENNVSRQVVSLSEATFFHGNTSIQAFMNMNTAQNWQQFKSAMMDYELAHNFSFADIKGNIGMISVAKVPIRQSNSGFNISSGWEIDPAIKEYLRPDKMLATLNPERGFLVNSNNKTEPWSYPYFISQEHVAPYRAERIIDVIEGLNSHSVENMSILQNDTVSPAVKILLPILLSVEPQNILEKKALDLLSRWDIRMNKADIEPLIYYAWERELNWQIYSDELGESASSYFSSHPQTIGTILNEQNEWCDNVNSRILETCEEIVHQSLKISLNYLLEVYGKDISKWHWGAAHHAKFENSILGSIPIVNRWANIEVESSGGPHTVNQAQMDYSDNNPFFQNYGPRYRQIIDLANIDNSQYMIAPGVSGNLMSPYYSHLSTAWSEGKYFNLVREKSKLKESSIGITKLYANN